MVSLQQSNLDVLAVREQSFLIPDTRAEDFWQGYETFFNHFVGVRKFYEQFLMGYKTILLENIWMKSSSKIERKVNRHLKMMNHWTSMKIA